MHVPIVYSSQFAGLSGKGLLGDALMELDSSVGVILDALEQYEAATNTMVWLTGDNGPPDDQCDWGGAKGPFLGRWMKRPNQGFGPIGTSSGKMTVWEAGHREVGVVRFPNSSIIPGSVSHALASTMDIVPTIAKLAGVGLPSDRTYDGIDLGPVLFDHSPHGHPFLFHSVGGAAYNIDAGGKLPLFEAVRVGELKAIYLVGTMPTCCRGPDGNANTPYNSTCGKHPKWLSKPLIFNLTVDAAESTPLAQSSQAYAESITLVQTAMTTMSQSLKNGLIHKAIYKTDLSQKICCNPANPVCRCNTISNFKEDQ